jgi:hypothetical protein
VLVIVSALCVLVLASRQPFRAPCRLLPASPLSPSEWSSLFVSSFYLAGFFVLLQVPEAEPGLPPPPHWHQQREQEAAAAVLVIPRLAPGMGHSPSPVRMVEVEEVSNKMQSQMRLDTAAAEDEDLPVSALFDKASRLLARPGSVVDLVTVLILITQPKRLGERLRGQFVLLGRKGSRMCPPPLLRCCDEMVSKYLLVCPFPSPVCIYSSFLYIISIQYL